MLVVDEIGCLPISRTGAMLFFQLMTRRYEHASTVLTSNQGFEEWGDIFGDDVMARGVKFPQKALKKKPAMIAGAEFAKLLRQLSEPHQTMVSLIAATGLRIGELLALRWSSLDLEVGALTVRESVFEGKFQAPKTQRAQRTIPLGPHAVKALNDHQGRVARKSEDALVFANRNGDPLRESKLLRNVLQPAAETAGLGRVTWHQFRHIHSSLLNDLKVR